MFGMNSFEQFFPMLMASTMMNSNPMAKSMLRTIDEASVDRRNERSVQGDHHAVWIRDQLKAAREDNDQDMVVHWKKRLTQILNEK